MCCFGLGELGRRLGWLVRTSDTATEAGTPGTSSPFHDFPKSGSRSWRVFGTRQ